jgi:hypothetical protein
MSSPIDQASPEGEVPRIRRSAGKWAILLTVWIVGLAVWVVYFAVAAVLLLRVL